MKIHKANTFTFDELFEMSKPEMDAIIKHFPLSVIYNMLQQTINGDSITECIYGRLTGNCENQETREFIKSYVSDIIEVNRENPLHIGYGKHMSLKEAIDEEKHRAAYFETPLEMFVSPTDEESDYFYEKDEDEWTESYLERIEKVKIYIKSKLE